MADGFKKYHKPGLSTEIYKISEWKVAHTSAQVLKLQTDTAYAISCMSEGIILCIFPHRDISLVITAWYAPQAKVKHQFHFFCRDVFSASSVTLMQQKDLLNNNHVELLITPLLGKNRVVRREY